jgi:uracil-DNA glycosylase
MKLPQDWENFLKNALDLDTFYKQLNQFITKYDNILPDSDKIFAVFYFIKPRDVSCVLFGEDPYPRETSACGVAFWDKEINSWQDRTNGNSLKNILKALLVARRQADYNSNIDAIREIALRENFKSPPQLFEHWISQGILLINTALTFSHPAVKKEHFEFWQPFHKKLIQTLNHRNSSPFYILWGNKARRWEEDILQSIDEPAKIIRQGHPTFIHQFMDRQRPAYSPFTEIIEKTGLSWY